MMAFAQPLTVERVMGNKAAPALDGLQRRGFAPPIVHDVLNAAGAPLDGAARAVLEEHVGHDLSGVRVHTGALAAASARAVGARAFTVGRDIVFGHGEYAPTTAAGRKLLAHEVAHVAQQDANRVPGTIPIGPHDAHEERAADAVAAGAPPSRAPAGPAVLRRQELPPEPERSTGDGNPWDPQLLRALTLRKQGKVWSLFATEFGVANSNLDLNYGIQYNSEAAKRKRIQFVAGAGDKLGTIPQIIHGDGPYGEIQQNIIKKQGTGGYDPGTKKSVLPELDLRFRKPGTSPQRFGAQLLSQPNPVKIKFPKFGMDGFKRGMPNTHSVQPFLPFPKQTPSLSERMKTFLQPKRFGAQLLSQPNPVQMTFPKFGMDGFMRGMPNTHPVQPFLPFPKQIPSLSERMKTFLQPKTGLVQPKWGGMPKLGGNHFEPPWFQHLPAFGTHPDLKDEQEQEHDH